MNLFLLHHRAAPVVLCRPHQPRPATTRSTTTTPTAVRMTTIFGPPSAHPAQTVATPIFAASRVSILPIVEGVTSLHVGHSVLPVLAVEGRLSVVANDF